MQINRWLHLSSSLNCISCLIVFKKFFSSEFLNILEKKLTEKKKTDKGNCKVLCFSSKCNKLELQTIPLFSNIFRWNTDINDSFWYLYCSSRNNFLEGGVHFSILGVIFQWKSFTFRFGESSALMRAVSNRIIKWRWALEKKKKGCNQYRGSP